MDIITVITQLHYQLAETQAATTNACPCCRVPWEGDDTNGYGREHMEWCAWTVFDDLMSDFSAARITPDEDIPTVSAITRLTSGDHTMFVAFPVDA